MLSDLLFLYVQQKKTGELLVNPDAGHGMDYRLIIYYR